MRILIHSLNYVPELTGIGKYSGEMAEWLAARGHEVRVVTAPPYYPQWKITDGFANWWGKERIQVSRGKFQGAGIRRSPTVSRSDFSPTSERRDESRPTGLLVVYRCPLWVPSRPSGLKRLLHLASFSLSSFPIMLLQVFWRPNVVMVIEPPLFCAPQAWLVARLSSGKAWLHIQDYEVDAAFDLGLLEGRWLRRMVTAGERWLMRRFDRVSTISQRMVGRALDKGVAPERVVLFRNWVEIGQDQGARGKGQGGVGGYRAELGIASDAVVALYSGNMGGKQGLEILAGAARILGEAGRSDFSPTSSCRTEVRPTEVDGGRVETRPAVEVVFVFCGNGAGRDDLVALCENLPNVRFLDLQPAERLGELLAMADIHLLPQRADAADLVMPSKLTGMLASGRPVVATADGGTELASVVEDRGLVVPPEDGLAFAEAIRTLALDAALRARLGKAGREYALEHLDKESVLGDFERKLAAVADMSR